MQVHVLGVGAVGALVAGHLRTVVRRCQLPTAGVQALARTPRAARAPRLAIPQHVAPYLPPGDGLGVTLHLRERRFARDRETPPSAATVTVERDGVRMAESGFGVELWSPASQGASQTLVRGAVGGAEPIESIIVATKADITCAALRRVAPRITPETTVVLLQNGLGVLDALLDELFPDAEKRPNFVLATTTHGCYLKRPLHTVHAGFGSIHFGIVPSARARGGSFEHALPPTMGAAEPELDLEGIPDTPATRSLRATVALMLALPLDVHWEPIRTFQLRALRKLVINACINGTTALADCKNGELFGSPAAAEVFRVLSTEAGMVLEAQARDAKAAQETRDSDAVHLSTLPLADLLTQTDADGLPLLDASLKPASIQHEAENVVRRTAANWSSMHQDIRSGRGSTEIDYINGYIGELGRAYGIPTPANDLVTNLVKLKARRVTGTWGAPLR
ncbi:hypothetical protein MSPP1_002721 [Malassezia sp. CBS 17886]|nr:hypothetical protein MSPP1_002721 [Malassezia sp. CBS 17886]